MAGECESATPTAGFTEQSTREHRPVWDGGAASQAASVRKKHAWTPTAALSRSFQSSTPGSLGGGSEV